MSEKSKSDSADIENVERRRSWQDRRADHDRRNPERLRLANNDCRSGIARRIADRRGELAEGEIWWRDDVTW